MNESIHGETTASELRDRVTELNEQQTAISEVLRAIASSPHDLQPIFDAILDSATRLCRADAGSLRLSEEGGLRRVALRGAPLLVSQAWSSFPALAEKGSFLSRLATSRLPTHIPDITALEGDLPYPTRRGGFRLPRHCQGQGCLKKAQNKEVCASTKDPFSGEMWLDAFSLEGHTWLN
jgi:hypothetical protein